MVIVTKGPYFAKGKTAQSCVDALIKQIGANYILGSPGGKLHVYEIKGHVKTVKIGIIV